MDRTDLHRKARLRELLKQDRFEGTRAIFCTQAGVSKSRLSQLLDDDDPFGERVARKIAANLRLGDKWFELPAGTERQISVVEKRDDRYSAMLDLPADLQDAVLKIIQGLHRIPPANRATK